MSYFLPAASFTFLLRNFGIFICPIKNQVKRLINYQLCRLMLLLCCVIILMPTKGLKAQNSGKPIPQSSFATRDIYQSAVFLENRDIVAPYKGEKVLYYLQHSHISAFFTEKGVIYQLTSIDTARYNDAKEKEQEEREARGKEEKEGQGQEDLKTTPIINSVMQMEWIGANPHPQIEASQKGDGYHTYLKPDGKSYTTLVTEGYKSLVYKNLYPGIDAEYSFPDKGGIEYNLIIHPGANTDIVKMVYHGDVLSVKKNDNGDVVVHTVAGDLIEHAPTSFTATTKVASAFEINNNTIQFKLLSAYRKH